MKKALIFMPAFGSAFDSTDDKSPKIIRLIADILFINTNKNSIIGFIPVPDLIFSIKQLIPDYASVPLNEASDLANVTAVNNMRNAQPMIQGRKEKYKFVPNTPLQIAANQAKSFADNIRTTALNKKIDAAVKDNFSNNGQISISSKSSAIPGRAPAKSKAGYNRHSITQSGKTAPPRTAEQLKGYNKQW